MMNERRQICLEVHEKIGAKGAVNFCVWVDAHADRPETA